MNFTIKPNPPFNFNLSAKIFSDGDKQIHGYENGKFWQVLNVNNKLIFITIKSSGTIYEPELSVDLKSNNNISDKDVESAIKIISLIFNLNLDLKSFYEEVKNDEILRKLIKQLKGLNSPTTPTVYEALVSSIIEQQISLKAAHSIESRMIKKFVDALKTDHHIYYAFPTPKNLASLNKEQLRECGLSYMKSEYVIDLSKLINDEKFDLEKLKDKYVDEIIRELCKIRGVGVWTAEIAILRGMHKLEAFPADDIGLRRAISHYYCNDRKISGEEARIIAAKWGKWKGLAGFYLIVAEIMSLTI